MQDVKFSRIEVWGVRETAPPFRICYWVNAYETPEQVIYGFGEGATPAEAMREAAELAAEDQAPVAPLIVLSAEENRAGGVSYRAVIHRATAPDAAPLFTVGSLTGAREAAAKLATAEGATLFDMTRLPPPGPRLTLIPGGRA